MISHYTRKNYLQRLINERNLNEIIELEFEDLEQIIQNNDYNTFTEIMKIAKDNDLNFAMFHRERFYHDLEFAIDTMNHWLWIREIPKLDTSKMPLNRLRSGNRTSTICRLIASNDVDVINKIIEIVNLILNKYNEIQLEIKIKNLPNYNDKNSYTSIDQMVVYYVCGLYLSYEKKHIDGIEKVKKLFE